MALAASLRFGGGDIHWFQRHDREDQIAILGLLHLEEEEAKDARRMAAANRPPWRRR